MYWYKGVFLDSVDDLEFVNSIETSYDVGVIKFRDKESLICDLICEDIVCVEGFDCKTKENRSAIEDIASVNRVGISW